LTAWRRRWRRCYVVRKMVVFVGHTRGAGMSIHYGSGAARRLPTTAAKGKDLTVLLDEPPVSIPTRALISTKRASGAGCTFVNVDGILIKRPGWSLWIPSSARTLAGFRAWAASNEFPERGRISYFGREIYIDMSPEELQRHNAVKTEISRVGANLNVELDLGMLFSDRTLVSNDAARLSTEPDACLATWRSLKAGRVRLQPHKDRHGEFTELRGSPDWMLEIVSRYSIRKDTEILWKKYHQAKIGEYWLVNALGDEIDFRIYLRGASHYVAGSSQGGWQRSRVFGRGFRLERYRHHLGLWRYVLRVRKP